MPADDATAPAGTAPAGPRPRRGARTAAAAVCLALVSAAMWFAWLGWDDEYHLVDGVAQGPYRTWQVVGCGLCVAAAGVVAQVLVRVPWAVPLLAAAAVVGFAVPWSVHAASTDDSGLWVVGLLFLLVGGGTGLTMLLGITALATRGRSGRSSSPA
ncbi:hypothetical protein [Nocardioides abyssi]|uniref:SPW repeat-containing protein n=1 Tax=Nocardioides abyssi TaxID=3058370 RepID=A0ABT8EV27_9ACTN|nr:hypothetical protein [Nocardioides abyssi]MDN4161972.1 hypothetical protein [Nocardioides abyssi]